MMAGGRCWLADRLEAARLAALVALQGQAVALGGAVEAAVPGSSVQVSADGAGAVVSVSGDGLAMREHGSAEAAPEPVVGAVVSAHRAAVVDAVRAALEGA